MNVRRATLCLVGFLALALDGSWLMANGFSFRPSAISHQPSEGVPVLVELFTAEGCSSCPPADKLVALMVQSQPATGVTIVALGEHVDYWDRSGWKDRFSSPAFTARQQTYADRLGLDSIYTPQLVVDGREAFVGTDVEAARRAIEQARTRPHGSIALTVTGSTTGAVALSIEVSGLPRTDADDRADILAALVEDDLQTDVKKGENRGRALTHAAVVRELATVAEASGSSQTAHAEYKIKADWKRDKLSVVAFVQERKSRHVLATATAKIVDR